MKSNHRLSKLLLVLALGGTCQVSAEDIDIFLANPDITGTRPNVLLVLDNAASNNSSITGLDGAKVDKLEMLRQVLNNIADPLNSPYFPDCTITVDAEDNEVREPDGCVTRQEVSKLLENINLGLMIANPSGADTGAYVRYHVRPMDQASNRTNLVAKINPGIPQANNAPYAKTMHEAYLYYGGKRAYAGFSSTGYDPGARKPDSSSYNSPASDACQDNYIVFVGNGGPDSGENNDANKLLKDVGGILPTDPVSFTPSNHTSNWFDEYGRTMKRQDVVPHLDGIQNVTTYTIAVQSPDDNSYKTKPMESARELLRSGALLGGGEYFEANDGQQVMKAFVDLLQKFQAVDSVFAASTLPVSVNVRGTFLNQVYMGQFRPDAKGGPRWPGNLKQYQIAVQNGIPFLADRNGKGVEDTVNGFIKSDVTSFWTTPSNYWAFEPMGNPASASDAPDGNIVEKGGVAQRLRQTFASRKLYTCKGDCTAGVSLKGTAFNAANADLAPELADWVRGADNIDNEDGNDVKTDVRARIHGDLLHSRPAVVNYNRTGNDRDIVVFYGTNSGVFHAVKGGQDDSDGYEMWGMVFPEFHARLERLRQNDPLISSTSPKPYFADGAVSVYQNDVNKDGKLIAADGDKVYLYVGMRRGGRFLYALDVSDPNDPKHMWKVDNTMTGFSELGQTWSAPRPAKVLDDAGSEVLAVIFGAGYDPENEDPLPAQANNKGRGIFVVNALNGALIKHIMPAGMGSVPADLAVLDRDDDGLFDRIYAADTKGNIWRVDINGKPSTWSVHKLAALGGSGADARKFLNKPDVVFGANYDAVLVGSGDREHPFENTVTNRFYMLKDTNIGATGGYVCETPANGEVPAEPRSCTETDLVDVTQNPYQDKAEALEHGWYLTLAVGEKVVGNAITVFGTTFFGTNRPTPPEKGVCSSNLGEAKLYGVGFEYGTATQDFNADGTLDSSDRAMVIEGGGFPPSPVYAKTRADGKDVDLVTSGSTVIKPEGVNSTTRRFRTYWHIEQ